jgi:hypothetical protein
MLCQQDFRAKKMIGAIPFDAYRSAVMLLRLLRKLKVIGREQKNRAHDLLPKRMM